MKDTNSLEKLALLALAAVSIVSLTWIALRALKAGSVDPNASALIGVIVTGLIAVSKDILAAIRSYAQSAQLGKVTDQLAASAPGQGAEPLPKNVQEAAQDTADAAQTKADTIKGEAE